MSECTVLGLKEELGKPNTTLVDVREIPEFASGRVPGAKLVPLGEIERRHHEIDHNHTVYVICRSGRRGAESQKKLQALGFTRVVNVKMSKAEPKRGRRQTCRWKRTKMPFGI